MKVFIFQALISLGVALITLLGGYFIYGPKLRKEQKSDFQKEIGRKKADALIEFKEIIRICDSIEVYDVEEEIQNKVVLKADGIDSTLYPAVMADIDSFNEFIDKVSSLRQSEMYLDNEAAAYLLYLYKYLYELMNFIPVNAPDTRLDTLGTLFIFDFQRWSDLADQIVVRDLNAAKVEIQSHKDDEWENVRDTVFNRLYNDSVLHILQKETGPEDDREVAIINCFNEITSD